MSNADTSDTKGNPPRKRFEKRNICDLKPHPEQDALFRPTSPEEFTEFKKDIKKNGIREPIEITLENVVISGHRRLQAAKELGWKTVQVWVRDDLADETAVALRHIEANRERRQLDTLDQMRLEVRKLEIEKKRKPGGLVGDDWHVLKARLENVLEKSGRSVQRYQNVLNAPMEVQDAYSKGKLPMKLAEKVGQQRPALQDEIAAAIRDGEDPTEAIVSRLRKPKVKPREPGKQLGDLVRNIEETMEDLSGHEKEIQRNLYSLENDLEVLKRFASYSKELRKVLTARRDVLAKELEADEFNLNQ
jgi:ParB-like chromosome segregation protein Spo0J